MNPFMIIVVAAVLMAGATLLFSLTLGGVVVKLAERHVKKNVKKYGVKLTAVLPGTNCGKCGYESCRAYADAMLWEGEKISSELCTEGGEAMVAEISACRAEFELVIKPHADESDKAAADAADPMAE